MNRKAIFSLEMNDTWLNEKLRHAGFVSASIKYIVCLKRSMTDWIAPELMPGGPTMTESRSLLHAEFVLPN